MTATTGAGGAAIGLDYVWNNESANKNDGGCDNENDAFHGGFLLVTADGP